MDASERTAAGSPSSGRSLVLKNLTKEYRAGQPVLKDISLTFADRGMTAIIGPSGALSVSSKYRHTDRSHIVITTSFMLTFWDFAMALNSSSGYCLMVRFLAAPVATFRGVLGADKGRAIFRSPSNNRRCTSLALSAEMPRAVLTPPPNILTPSTIIWA